MAKDLGSHPSAEALQAFGLGKLDDRSSDTVNQHLETCVDCRQHVAALSGDSLLNRLQEARRPDGTPPPTKSLSDLNSTFKTRIPDGVPAPLFPPELASNPQYDILKELGRGGMGVVYLARNKVMDRLEVLKVVNKNLVDRPGSMERFLREIQTAAKLQHENVVSAYSALQTGDLLAFAMEYVEGQDLAQVVKAQGPLGVANACHYARQAALGLQHAHDKGTIHRDIKPQNLILARVGKKHTVKILDFGLAKVAREKGVDTGLTGVGALLGTPDYMAPEQTRDAATVDIRADIYSLGCTLYYLLTGKTPYQANNLLELLQSHQSVEAERLNLVRPEVPIELAAVVAKMMAKDPAKRFQKPVEVAQALAAFLKPGAIATSPPAAPAANDANPEPRRSESISKPKTVAHTVLLAAPVALPADQRNEDSSKPSSLAPPTLLEEPNQPNASKTKTQSRGRKPLWIGGGIALGVVFLGLVLSATGVFRVQTPEGTIVLENVPEGAEVFVDGSQVKIKTPGIGEPWEIRTKSGSRKLEIRKGGVTIDAQDVALDAGGHKRIQVRLEPMAQANKKAQEIPIPVPSKKDDTELLKDLPAKVQYAVHLNGTTDRIRIPKSNFNYGGKASLTIEFVIVPYGPTLKNQHILCNAGGESGLSLTLSTENKWRFSVFSPVGPFSVIHQNKVDFKRRTHLAAVFDRSRSTLRLFVNGKMSQDETHVDKKYTPGSWAWIIGADPQYPGNRYVGFFHGDIEQFRISRTARYTGDYEPPASLVRDGDTDILYLFEEGMNTTIRDPSAVNRDAKLESGTWVPRLP